MYFTNLKGADSFFDGCWGDGADDDRFRVSAQGVLEYSRQLAVPVVGEAPV